MMLTTRFPCLLNAPKRAYSLSTLTGQFKWRPLRQADTLSLINSSGNKPTWRPLSREDLSSQEPVLYRTTPALKKLSTEKKSEISATKSTPPQLPITGFANVFPELRYEDHTIGDRFPIRYRIYHPNGTSPLNARIFYIPPPHPNFIPLELAIPFLSDITSATIITPLPPLANTETIKPFPQPLHNLLQIYDHWNTVSAPTAILTSGIAASPAAAIALTEESVQALGVMGGILDLTTHAKKATAWNRKCEKWDHFKPPPSTAVKEIRLGITEEEFWKLRKQYFPNPETWADPFASPQLFCRSASVEFSRLTMKQIWGKKMLEGFKSEQKLSGGEWERYGLDDDDEGNFIYPRRQARIFQNFPPQGREKPFPWIKLILPAVREGKDDVTAAQGRAFADATKTALAQWYIRNRDKRKREEKSDAMMIAESKIFTERLKENEGWENAVWNIGHWLNWVFNEVPKM